MADEQDSVADMLRPHADDITAPLAGIEQQRHRQSGARADRMRRLELGDLGFGPGMDPPAFDLAAFDAFRRVISAQFDVEGKFHQSAQCLQHIAGGEGF